MTANPGRCRVCQLPPADRTTLEAAARSGEAVAPLAARFNIPRSSVLRHLASHASQDGGPSPPPEPEDQILGELATLQKVCRAILGSAMQDDRHEMALRSVREASRLLKQSVELTQRLQQSRLIEHVDLRLDESFRAFSRAAARALEPYPEARQALSRELAKTLRRR